MANAWFRMYAEFLTDPKVQMLSEVDQRRYIMLLCMRCSNGDVTLHDEIVAFQLRIAHDDWMQTKARLLANSLITEENKPSAWEKRQFISDSSAARVAKHREKMKRQCNVTVTPPDTDTDTDTDMCIPSNEGAVSSKLPTIPNCPHQKILDLYAECLPELPQPRIWEGQRKQNLAARWKWAISDLKKRNKAHDTDAGLEFFRGYFEYVAKSDFLTGKVNSWQADLGWLCNAGNFAKVVQGNFENRGEVENERA